jgi:hypothetical protein
MTVNILSNYLCLFFILLLITILLVMGYLPLNAVLALLVEIVNPYFNIIFSNLCIDFCNEVSDFAIIT